MPQFLKKRLPDTHLTAIFMIALTTVITHGLLIPRLGYYYDDWYMLWSGAIRGRDSLAPLFGMDRPFMGVIYIFLYRFFRDSILNWHLATLVIRIAGGVAFYWILNLAWPKLKYYSVPTAMLFVVFPGFLAEPNAATKINHLIGYGAALFSIAFTLQAVKTDRKPWKYACVAISLLLMALYLWIYEYMVGLEVMRVVLLFWLLWQGERGKIITAAKKAILNYLPYIFVMGLFLFWRVFIFDSTRPATDLKGLVTDYQTNYLALLPRLLFQWVSDFFTASLFAWFVQLYHLLAKVDYGEVLIALLFACGVVLLAIAYIFATRDHNSTEEEALFPRILVMIGMAITLAAVFPVVLLNRHIDLMDPYKGYALHPSAGVMIMVIGLVLMLKPKFRMPVLIVLLGLSVATQSLNIQEWGKFWDLERGMWWQLTWRAPNIRNDTLLMAYLPNEFTFQQDYEIWGPVNLIYRPDPDHYPLIQSEVLNQDTAFEALEGNMSDPHVRDIYVPKNYKNLLLISQPTALSCIHVIDGSMPAYSTSERPIVRMVGEKSNTNLIHTSGTAPIPPVDIFGKEPEHGWCFYYQQASLVRQVGDWNKIGALYEAAVSAGLKPADPSEYFVFIEGLVNLGKDKDASQIVKDVIKDNDNNALKYSFCSSLSSAPAFPASFGYRRDQIIQIVCQ